MLSLEEIYIGKIYQEKGFRVKAEDLLQMQVYQRVLYTALTVYSPHSAHRIALESPWATKNFTSGSGGVEETAEEIKKIWLSFEEKNKKSPLLPRFKKTGGWPDQTFEVL